MPISWLIAVVNVRSLFLFLLHFIIVIMAFMASIIAAAAILTQRLKTKQQQQQKKKIPNDIHWTSNRMTGFVGLWSVLLLGCQFDLIWLWQRNLMDIKMCLSHKYPWARILPSLSAPWNGVKGLQWLSCHILFPCQWDKHAGSVISGSLLVACLKFPICLSLARFARGEVYWFVSGNACLFACLFYCLEFCAKSLPCKVLGWWQYTFSLPPPPSPPPQRLFLPHTYKDITQTDMHTHTHMHAHMHACLLITLVFIICVFSCFSFLSVRDELVVATEDGNLNRLRWNGNRNDKATLHLSDIPVSSDLQQFKGQHQYHFEFINFFVVCVFWILSHVKLHGLFLTMAWCHILHPLNNFQLSETRTPVSILKQDPNT